MPMALLALKIEALNPDKISLEKRSKIDEHFKISAFSDEVSGTGQLMAVIGLVLAVKQLSEEILK
jgi:hypothetical protein